MKSIVTDFEKIIALEIANFVLINRTYSRYVRQLARFLSWRFLKFLLHHPQIVGISFEILSEALRAAFSKIQARSSRLLGIKIKIKSIIPSSLFKITPCKSFWRWSIFLLPEGFFDSTPFIRIPGWVNSDSGTTHFHSSCNSAVVSSLRKSGIVSLFDVGNLDDDILARWQNILSFIGTHNKYSSFIV